MKKYVFRPYKDFYPVLYLREAKRLRSFLGGFVSLEHIGSTAVPGLGGKGVVDIYVIVPKKDMGKYSKLIQKAGYEYKSSGGDKNRIFHQRDSKELSGKTIRYHLHLTFPENQDWKNSILFRDYLRQHSEEAKRYAQIKQQAAKESNQTKEKYMAIKEPVIKEILDKALKEQHT